MGAGGLSSSFQPVTAKPVRTLTLRGRCGVSPQKGSAETRGARPQGKTFPSKAMLNSKFSNQTHGRFTYGDYNSRRTYCFRVGGPRDLLRSEEHTSELQSLMRISYAVFCLKQTIKHHHN